MGQNTDFTNGRKYDQYEHARALYSGMPDNATGFDISGNITLSGGKGINHGSPFQISGNTILSNPGGTYSIVIKTTLTESGNAGIGNTTIITTKQTLQSNDKTKYMKLYDMNGTTIVKDYRRLRFTGDLALNKKGNNKLNASISGNTTADVNLVDNVTVGGSGNKVNVTINGIKSNDYTLPITSSGSVDLSNYYTKSQTYNRNEVDTKLNKVQSNALNPTSNGWVNFNGLYGGNDLRFPPRTNIWDYDALLLKYDNEIMTIDLQQVRAVNGISRGATNKTANWHINSMGVNGGNMLLRALDLTIYDNKVTSFGSIVYDLNSRVAHINNNSYAINYYALVKNNTTI